MGHHVRRHRLLRHRREHFKQGSPVRGSAAREDDVGDRRVLDAAARCHPRVEQAGGLESRLEARPRLSGQVCSEVDQPPQRRAGALAAIGAEPSRSARSVVVRAGQPVDLRFGGGNRGICGFPGHHLRGALVGQRRAPTIHQRHQRRQRRGTVVGEIERRVGGRFVQFELHQRRSPAFERGRERRAGLLELVLARRPLRRRPFQSTGGLALPGPCALGVRRGPSRLTHELAVAVEHVAPVDRQVTN